MDSANNSLEQVEIPVHAADEPSSPFLVVGSVTATTAPPNRSLSSRPHRSRRGFAAGKSRLSLKIDADCSESASGTGQSTPASTSSSCSSDVVPWWEVEYQCPPPGHLGAHVVPVSADEQVEQRTSDQDPANGSSTVGSATTTLASVQLTTPTTPQTDTSSTPQQSAVLRPGLVAYETPERARRGPRSKLSAIRASAPCCTSSSWTRFAPSNELTLHVLSMAVLVDSSPSQKRKMRPQDPTDSLFSKELKRFHQSRFVFGQKCRLPIRQSR
jgi:hypothetical protein